MCFSSGLLAEFRDRVSSDSSVAGVGIKYDRPEGVDGVARTRAARMGQLRTSAYHDSCRAESDSDDGNTSVMRVRISVLASVLSNTPTGTLVYPSSTVSTLLFMISDSSMCSIARDTGQAMAERRRRVDADGGGK